MATTKSAAEAPTGDDGQADTLKEVLTQSEEDVDAALLAAFTNSEIGDITTTHSAPVEPDFDALVPMTSIEHNFEARQPMDSSKAVGVTEATDGIDNNDQATATMQVLTSSFEPASTLGALKDTSNDPTLFGLSDWEGLSPAAEPSSAILASNPTVTATLASPFQSAPEPSVPQAQQAFIQPPREPSMPPRTQYHFPVALNPNVIDLRTGRRRSQSVPPSSEPKFTRRMGNGRMKEIGMPQPPPSLNNSVRQHPYPSAYMTHSEPTPFISTRVPQRPYVVALPPTHPHPTGMMTEPASPAPYTHIAPYAHHPGYNKRPFHHYDEHDDRGKPEPKRRARKKTPSPSGRGGGPAPAADLWSTEILMENVRCLVGQKMDDVRATSGGNDVEL